jgi:hypothetical protein
MVPVVDSLQPVFSIYRKINSCWWTSFDVITIFSKIKRDYYFVEPKLQRTSIKELLKAATFPNGCWCSKVVSRKLYFPNLVSRCNGFFWMIWETIWFLVSFSFLVLTLSHQSDFHSWFVLQLFHDVRSKTSWNFQHQAHLQKVFFK